jgi:hypothetical protein
MDYEDLFIPQFFSLLYDLPPNSHGTPTDTSRHTGWKSLHWSIKVRFLFQFILLISFCIYFQKE